MLAGPALAESKRPDADKSRQGGSFTSTRAADKNALRQPARAVRKHQRMDFVLGQAIFEKFWVSAPSTTTASDGLGPLYNARSCHQCHVGNGRGAAPDVEGKPPASLVARFGSSGPEPLADPVYGAQLQTFSTGGLSPEGRIKLAYSSKVIRFDDGEQVSLRKPGHQLDLPHGELAATTAVSYRSALALAGVGLLERIPEAQILRNEDPRDLDKDGISGHANRIRIDGADRLGRYGWKAGQISITAQNRQALLTDIGLSTPQYGESWGDCTSSQIDCRRAPHGDTQHLDGVEVSNAMLDVLNTYVAGLAVPARRNPDEPDVQAGETLFRTAGCESCHRSSFQLMDGEETISPWTDLLLHDMGDGLADDQAEHLATGREWRTPPLWGIGLAKTVNPEAGFLHDGRARTLLEAVLWHDGEAASARRFVLGMSAAERRQLISFLESL
ncbi:MAG: c-type cytochrome [Gammaproteobacteria bacterium]|nr:c-type cytochrome [Gammaproteobacteria bacterium]